MAQVTSTIKTNILLIFLGEIFAAVASISIFSGVAPALSLLSVFAIASFVLILIAVISLRNHSEPFRKVFIATLAAIIVAVISLILASILIAISENAAAVFVLTIISAIISALGLLINVYTTINIVKGCSLLINGREDSEFGKRTLITYAGATITQAVIVIVASCQVPYVVAIVLSSLGLVFILIAHILLIILLGNTYSRLEHN